MQHTFLRNERTFFKEHCKWICLFWRMTEKPWAIWYISGRLWKKHLSNSKSFSFRTEHNILNGSDLMMDFQRKLAYFWTFSSDSGTTQRHLWGISYFNTRGQFEELRNPLKNRRHSFTDTSIQEWLASCSLSMSRFTAPVAFYQAWESSHFFTVHCWLWCAWESGQLDLPENTPQGITSSHSTTVHVGWSSEFIQNIGWERNIIYFS